VSNVIRFFELVGQSSDLRHASKGELQNALKYAQIDPALHSAIINRDAVQIHALLDSQNRIYCSVFPTEVPRKKPGKAPAKKPRKTPPKKPAKKAAKARSKAR
jgi:hypothetical protein